jgi:hypothetical protein
MAKNWTTNGIVLISFLCIVFIWENKVFGRPWVPAGLDDMQLIYPRRFRRHEECTLREVSSPECARPLSAQTSETASYESEWGATLQMGGVGH